MTALVAILVAAALPAPNAPLPSAPARLTEALARTTRDLGAAVDRWGGTRAPPRDVVLLALYQQRIERLLAKDDRVARAVFPHAPAGVRSDVLALRELRRLATPQPLGRFRTRRPEPPEALRSYYRAGERRFRVGWNVLAAVNYVESAFGKLANASVAGAQGPMQFLPSTWRAYGLGGEIDDAHDAVLAAANYLHAHGAPRNYRRALYAYNPSPLYVDAVLRYARRIRRDRRAFLTYYSRQVFVLTPSGDRRITGP